jgi:hypothetical protein
VTELPPLPHRIGYDRRRVVRGAVILLFLATVVGAVLANRLGGRPTALGDFLASRGLDPVLVPFLIVEALALLLIALSVAGAWRQRDHLILREEGIEFHNHLGGFLVKWDNVDRLEIAPAGYVGIRLRDRSLLLETHRGTVEQRERLAELEPFAGYDLILHPEQLACGTSRFVSWAEAVQRRPRQT